MCFNVIMLEVMYFLLQRRQDDMTRAWGFFVWVEGFIQNVHELGAVPAFSSELVFKPKRTSCMHGYTHVNILLGLGVFVLSPLYNEAPTGMT